MENTGKGFRTRMVQIPVRSQSYQNASIGKRFLALVLDLLLLNIVVFSPFRDLLLGAMEGFSLTTELPSNVYASIIFMSIVALLYFALLQRYEQQTIGMMIMRIRVVPKPGFWRAVTRNLFILPFFPFSLLWVVEPVFLLWKKRRLLETLTATNTVEVQRG